jgi:uroporphyrinogen-III synthase
MNLALEQLGATVEPIALYRWELPDDLAPLREAARRVASREFDVVLFTSSIQLDHLFAVAADLGIEPEVRAGLSDTVIASIGPVMTDALIAHGFPPDVIPKHPKLWSLVRAAAEESPAILAARRAPVTPS